MPAGPRPRRDPTDDWQQLRLLVASPEQEAYELLRPIVLFGLPTATRARETGVPERTLRRQRLRVLVPTPKRRAASAWPRPASRARSSSSRKSAEYCFMQAGSHRVNLSARGSNP